MNSGKTFKFDLGFIPHLTDKFNQQTLQYDRQIQRRVQRATDMVWRIAHQKRPMISKTQMKAEGRAYRVSDPNAKAGVPVRTGALQASVQQKVYRTKLMSYIGEVWTNSPYAAFIEYGTSKMLARPFMRPAITLTKDAIKRMFGLRVEGRL